MEPGWPVTVCRTRVAPPSWPDLDAWGSALDQLARRRPFEAAVLAGHGADRLGFAFLGAYRAAVRALVPDLGTTPAALCVTEAAGAHPARIAASLRPVEGGWRLDGEKQWTTAADRARVLLVAASTGHEGERNLLRVARVPRDAAGVHLEALPPTPFTPEIPHFKVTFTDVRLPPAWLLPGDGWTRWIRPFRTIEDLHVLTAATAWLLAVGTDAGWAGAWRARGVALLHTLADLSEADPSAPATHIALDGAFQAFEAWADAPEVAWDTADEVVRHGWERDRALLGVASVQRARRTERAWERIQSGARSG